MAKSTREIIKDAITKQAHRYSNLTTRDITGMTEFALDALESGKAQDVGYAVYLAFDNEFQGGSV